MNLGNPRLKEKDESLLGGRRQPGPAYTPALSAQGPEPEEDVDAVDVAAVEPDGVGALRGDVLEAQEVVGHLGGSRHLAGAVQPQDQQVHHQPIVLHNEGGELQPPDYPVRVGVVHVL